MRPIADTLETLLAPGRRFRLSPLVEATQRAVLFGQEPDERRRAESIRAILEAPAARQVLDEIAGCWERFQQRDKPFSEADTYQGTFLQTYLAYYTTSNIPKLQAVLTELVGQDALPPRSCRDGALRVLDIGVGRGTTALAVLDFVLAWESCCRLWNQPFPLESVELAGLDRSVEALKFARIVTQAFGEQVDRWLAMREAVRSPRNGEHWQRPARAWAERVRAACDTARWEAVDLTRRDHLARAAELVRWADMVVVSYVLRELRDAESEDNLSHVLAAARPGTLVLLLESGGKGDARGLMRWRRRFLRRYPAFRTLLPCGQEFGATLPACCDDCWPSRREGLHQTALYRSFVERCPTLREADDRYDDFENELLSWTYVALQRQPAGAGQATATLPPATQIPRSGAAPPITTRVVGRFLGSAPLVPDPNRDATSHTAQEYVKLCPGHTEVRSLVLRRRPGFAVPRLRHGELVTLEGMCVAGTRDDGLILEPGDGDRSRVVPQRTVQPTTTPFLPAYTEAVRDALDDVAYRLFGFPALRRFQRLILERVLTGRSVLGIAATGSGKSECFILPAMLLPGFTVVVSPLKALMQDQFEQRIRERYGLDDLCTYLNGEVPVHERDRRLRLLEQGYYKLVYVTPEQLQRDWVIESLKRAHQKVPGGFRYLAMDEAHCVSQWGHDFRPAYLNIVQRLRQHGLEPKVIALTATASPQVREDLCWELQLDQRPIEEGGDVLVDASNRPELNLIVEVFDTTEQKAQAIARRLRHVLERNRNDQAEQAAAIVFMPWTGRPDDTSDPSSPRVTEFAAWLETILRERVSIYHGKMDDEPAEDGQEEESAAAPATAPALGSMRGRSRRAEQDAFIRGERAIMVATKGFGMGVDKPNIRLVLHRTPPANMEAYWQEAGRAGRDGDLADVVVSFSPDTPPSGRSDYEIQERFLSEKYVRPLDVEAMVAFLRTRQPTRVGTLYFTADEAIAFLERPDSGFFWPEFDTPRHNAWGEHAEILNRGHYYDAKCRYLDRIIQAFQSFRPFIDGRFVSLVDEAHDCGTELHRVGSARPDIKRIFDSNLYFGLLLREKERQIPNVRERFSTLVRGGNVLALAELLELPVHETGALLLDIRRAEGQRETSADGQRRWRGTLLDFEGIRAPLRGAATGKTTLKAWRDYAGAIRRASRKTADERAQRAGRRRPGLDDWFSGQEVSRRRGWEVKLSEAFAHPEKLGHYVRAFAEQMERRERYDWEAYLRFLTEYIGVERAEDGSWRRRSGRLPCLRGVVLGYLKTNEVVTGASCLSCSRCVPDLAFSTDIEARRRAIERLGRELAELLERLEGVPDRWLEPSEVDALAAAVSSEIASGKRVGEYLSGLTDRLLTDTPEHRPALVVRLLAACRGWIEHPPDEVVQLAERVIELADDDSARATVDRLLLQEATPLLTAAPLLRDVRALARATRETRKCSR